MRLLIPVDQTDVSQAIVGTVERTVLPLVEEAHIIAVLDLGGWNRSKRGSIEQANREWSHEQMARHVNWVIYPLYLPEGERPWVPASETDSLTDDAIRENARSYLAEASSAFGWDVAVHRTVIESGDPAEAIVEYARGHDIDLIAMATRGRSGVSRAVRGSVTDEVIRSGVAPVLVKRVLDD